MYLNRLPGTAVTCLVTQPFSSSVALPVKYYILKGDCLKSAFSLRSIEFLDSKRVETKKKRQKGPVTLKKIRPVHVYPDIFESATFSLRIQKFPRPHVSGFKSNLPVHTYHLTRIWMHFTTQDSSGNIGNRVCASLPSRIQYSR